ncbi:MAG: histidine kinase [Velocimicrobium sp.]
MTLRRKLVLTFVITIIMLGALIGYFSYMDSERIVISNKKSEMADTINRIDININAKVRGMTELAQNLSMSQSVRELLIKKNTDKKDTKQDTYVKEAFKNFVCAFEAISDIMIVDMKGSVLFSYNERYSIKNNEELKQYYKFISQKTDKANWIGTAKALCVKDEVGDDLVVTMVKAIMDEKGTKELGLLVVELNPDIFSNLLLSNQSMFQNQYTFIVDKKGDIICSNKNMKHTWLNKMEENFENGIRKFELIWEGKTYYVCGQYNGVTGWKTFSAVSLDDFFPQSSVLRKAIYSLVFITVIIAVAIVSLLAYTMTKPINDLAGAMKVVQEGNFDLQLKNSRKDEIGHLIDSFNFMIEKINTLIKEVYQEKIAQKNAELGALQAQINPHFLYNTLDSINWMLIEREEYDISEVVISLGDLMKYSIHGKNAFVTLEEELHYILSYLCIQKNRLEERLLYDIEIPATMNEYFVPKLILQPLVENAILHGIEPKREGGRIWIRGCETKECILISVTDNGEGMKREELTKLTYELEKREEPESIGVRNVDRRIRLHYGDAYGLDIKSKWKEGTTITLYIPK